MVPRDYLVLEVLQGGGFFVSEKRIITTISIGGNGAEQAFKRAEADPANFVFPVHEGENVISTPFGKVGVEHGLHERDGSRVRTVVLDCSDAPGLLWRSRKTNPLRTVSINREGTGSQQVRKFEIFVATTHFQRS